MRKQLLSLALALIATAMQAQSWTPPTLTISTEAVPDSAYLYHIGQQMFLTNGTTWGTHAALTDDASSALLYQFQATSTGAYNLYSAQAGNTGLLGRSTYNQLYTNYNSQSGWATDFVFNKVGDYYRIQTDPNSAYFGTASDTNDETDYNDYLMGWKGDNDDLNSSGVSLGTNVGIFMLDPTYDDVELDWGFVLVEVYEIYSARQTLYNTLNEAAEAGVSYATASSVYTNNNATADELNAASEQLQQDIKDAQFNTASEENPVDMTSTYMVNADFSAGSLEGWTTDNGVLGYDSGTLPNSNCTATEWNNGESSSHNAAHWVSSSSTVADDRLYQTISGLPAGKYVLTGSFVAQHSTDMPTGVYLFANGVVESRIAVQHDETLWNEAVAAGTNNQRIIRPELEIVHAGGDLTVGLEISSTNCNWVYAMWFQLICYGQTDMNAYALALSQTLTEAQTYEDDVNYIYSEETYNELLSQIENANSLIANGAEDSEYEEASNSLNTLIETIKEEVSAYTTLATLVENLYSDIESYTSLPTLVEELENMLDECGAAYEDRTATIEQINTWTTSYDTTILNAVKTAMADATPDNPVEITALATNMSYDDNTWDGWTKETGSFSSSTGNVSYQVAEVWNNTFSCMQTLENMPAGSYKLTAKAFYRTGSTADGYAAYLEATEPTEGILTYLSVAGGTSPVVNQAAGAIEAEEAPYTGYTSPTDGVWFPNTMQSASWAFSQDDTYLCSATGYLTTDGDLTFGIYNEELSTSNAWSLWDDFHLYYCGIDLSALYEQMLSVANEAIAMQDDASMISEADKLLNEAIGTAEELSENSSEEELIAAIDQLNEAIDYVNTGLDLIDDLIDVYDTYSIKVNEVESDDEAFPTLISEIGDAISEESFESNSQIENWINSLATAWTAYVQYNALGGTVDEPTDVTNILVNPNFDSGTNDNTANTGWTREYTTSGGHVGIASTTQQEASNYAAEFWQCTTFNFYQDIIGLAEGYYRISANAVSRHSTPSVSSYMEYLADPEATSNVRLYANSKEVAVPHLFSEARTESTFGEGEDSFEYDGVTYYYVRTMQSCSYAFDMGLFMNTVDVYLTEGETLRIGLRLVGTGETGNSCVWDNFTLQYMGNTEAPTAIESVVAAAPTGDGAIYDLSGRRVQKPTKGLYIVNGQKVMVK